MQRHSRIVKVFEDETEQNDFLKWLNTSSSKSQQIQRILAVSRNERRRPPTDTRKRYSFKLPKYKLKMIQTRGTRYEDNADNVNTKTSH